MLLLFDSFSIVFYFNSLSNAFNKISFILSKAQFSLNFQNDFLYSFSVQLIFDFFLLSIISLWVFEFTAHNARLRSSNLWVFHCFQCFVYVHSIYKLCSHFASVSKFSRSPISASVKVMKYVSKVLNGYVGQVIKDKWAYACLNFFLPPFCCYCFFVLCYLGGVSICSLFCPHILCTAQDYFVLRELYLPQSPKCWNITVDIPLFLCMTAMF